MEHDQQTNKAWVPLTDLDVSREISGRLVAGGISNPIVSHPH
jgi:hypothetical protein